VVCGHGSGLFLSIVEGFKGAFNIREEGINFRVGIVRRVQVVDFDIESVQTGCEVVGKDGTDETLELNHKVAVTGSDGCLLVRVVRWAAEAKGANLGDGIRDHFPLGGIEDHLSVRHIQCYKGRDHTLTDRAGNCFRHLPTVCGICGICGIGGNFLSRPLPVELQSG